MAGRRKRRHVRADLGEDRLSRSALDPGDRHQALNLWGERAELLLDVGANGGDRLLEVVEVREDLAEQERRESLGSHWASLSAEQQDEFAGLFGQLFERSYNRLVLRFLGDSTTTYGAESVEKNGVVVRTTLVRKNTDELPVDYRLTSAGGLWKISDVVVDGVSLAGNFHAQFEKTIRTASYDELVKKIRTKLAEER